MNTKNVMKKNKSTKAMKAKNLKRKEKNLSKRKNLKFDENDVSEDEEQPVKKLREGDSPQKLLNPKLLKKQAITELNELHEILGVTESRDEKERELEDFIFGRDSEDLRELDDSGSDSDSNKETEKAQEKKVDKKPAWEDDDDENILVEEKANTLKNCHRSMIHKGKEKYSSFVRDKLKNIVGDSSWAELGRKASSDDESDNELLQKTGNFIQASKSLPRGLVRLQKCPSLTDETLKNTIVKCVEFHPVARVAIVAGCNGTANLFQIDGKINAKIQSVYFENFPIHAAHFTLNGNEFIVGSNRFGHFFSYDMMSGKITRIPWDKGMEQKNIRRFQMSPDGKYIVIQGRYGHIHLVTTSSKEWIGSLKMNGEVISITFNKDGSKMYSTGDTGEIYVWDMNTRRCIHKFVDEGCVIGTSLTLSPNDQFLASGSDSGVVNIYDNTTLLESNSPKPIKVLMNLTTEVTHMKFNCTSELLAMSSLHKENAVKLVHFPSMTAFSNFPVREDLSSLHYINTLDISVNSGYLCLGNNYSTVHIFRLVILPTAYLPTLPDLTEDFLFSIPYSGLQAGR